MATYPFRKRVRITSKWKQPVRQPSGKILPHNGIDFGTVDLRRTGKKANEDMLAMLDGVITDVTNLGVLGWAYKVYYPSRKQTQYGVHMKNVIVKEGQKVKEGQVLAHVGVAKKQTMAEHTHFQLRKGKESGGLYKVSMDSKSVNPTQFLNKAKLVSEQKPTQVDPKDKQIKELLADNATLKKSVETLQNMLTEKDKLEDVLNAKVVEVQTERDKVLSDIVRVSDLLDVVYDKNMQWVDAGTNVGLYYKYLGAVANIKANALVDARFIELFSALLNKIFTKK